MANNGSLKEIVGEHLQCSLSADRTVRGRGEQALSMLEANEDYPLILMEISLSEGVFDFEVRHLAAVLLDGYISRHWSEDGSKYVGPPVSERVKPVLRQYLLKSLTISGPPESSSRDGIHGPTKRLLASYAHSISKIAAFDWPSSWPELFPALCEYLASGQASAIFSTLAVFGELAHEISDMQIPSVAPILLPAMLDIFTSSGASFQPRYRASAITVFVTLSETILLMAEYQKDAIRQYLEPHITRYAEAVVAVLGAPESGPEAATGAVDVALKADIIAGLTKLLKSSGEKRLLKAYLPRLMELIWRGLTTSAPVYVQRVVNSESFDESGLQGTFDFYAEPETTTGKKDGGNSNSFEAYLYAILEFVMHLFEASAKYRGLMKPVLADLLHHLLLLVQVTDEQAEVWTADLEQFLEDDDLDSAGYSVRLSAQDLLLAIARELCVPGTSSSSTSAPSKRKLEDDHLFKVAFLSAIKRHFTFAAELEKNPDPQVQRPWWKAVEACLFSLGMIAPTVIYSIKAGGDLAAEYQAILDSVLSSMNTQGTMPFLAGRSLWTAARFSPILNDASLEGFLGMTASVLSSSSEVESVGVLKIYALRATYYFCDNVAVNQKVHVIKPHLPQFLQGLISLGLGAASETLYLVLQTIAILLRLDSSFTASVAAPITSLATSAFLQFLDDPTVFDVALDLVDELLRAEVGAFALVAERLLPTIIGVLQVTHGISASNRAEGPNVNILLKDASGMDSVRSIPRGAALSLQPEAIDLLTHLLRASPLPLSEALVGAAYPALIKALAAASPEDSGLLQNGSEAVRWFIGRGAEQLGQRSFEMGGTTTNGIALALNLCNHLLSPALPESCSTYVGRLAVMLITRSQRVLGPEAVQALLRAILVKLNTAQELPLTQSLVLVFAHLFYGEHLPTMLGFLQALPAPENLAADPTRNSWSSALAFLLDRWLSVQLFFVGYENKAAVLALCRLFAHSLEEGVSEGGDEQINLHRIEVSTESGDGSSAGPEENSGGAIRTRSWDVKRSQGEDLLKTPKTIPATVKMLKLLLNEYMHMLEMKVAADADFSGDEDDEDEDDDDEDDNDEDDNDPNGRKLLASIQGFQDPKDQKIIDLTDLLLADDEDGGDRDDDEEQWEILSEEIAAIDLKVALREMLHRFKAAPVAGQFVAHLTGEEREVLAGL